MSSGAGPMTGNAHLLAFSSRQAIPDSFSMDNYRSPPRLAKLAFHTRWIAVTMTREWNFPRSPSSLSYYFLILYLSGRVKSGQTGFTRGVCSLAGGMDQRSKYQASCPPPLRGTKPVPGVTTSQKRFVYILRAGD